MFLVSRAGVYIYVALTLLGCLSIKVLLLVPDDPGVFWGDTFNAGSRPPPDLDTVPGPSLRHAFDMMFVSVHAVCFPAISLLSDMLGIMLGTQRERGVRILRRMYACFVVCCVLGTLCTQPEDPHGPCLSLMHVLPQSSPSLCLDTCTSISGVGMRVCGILTLLGCLGIIPLYRAIQAAEEETLGYYRDRAYHSMGSLCLGGMGTPFMDYADVWVLVSLGGVVMCPVLAWMTGGVGVTVVTALCLGCCMVSGTPLTIDPVLSLFFVSEALPECLGEDIRKNTVEPVFRSLRALGYDTKAPPERADISLREGLAHLRCVLSQCAWNSDLWLDNDVRTAVYALRLSGVSLEKEVTVLFRKCHMVLGVLFPKSKWYQHLLDDMMGRHSIEARFSAFLDEKRRRETHTLEVPTGDTSPLALALMLLRRAELHPLLSSRYDIPSIRRELLRGTIYKVKLFHPCWHWVEDPIPHWQLVKQCRCKESFFEPETHAMLQLVVQAPRDMTGMTTRYMDTNDALFSEAWRCTTDIPPFVLPKRELDFFNLSHTQHRPAMQKFNALRQGGQRGYLKFQHRPYYDKDQKTTFEMNYVTQVVECPHSHRPIRLSFHQMEPRHSWHMAPGETLPEVSVPEDWEKAVLPFMALDLARHLAEDSFDVNRFVFSVPVTPLTHLAIYAIKSLGLLLGPGRPDAVSVSEERIEMERQRKWLLCLVRIFTACEPLIQEHDMSSPRHSILVMQTMYSLLGQAMGPGSWFSTTASMALIVAAFFQDVDRPVQSLRLVEATDHPLALFHGEHCLTAHSLSLFLLCDHIVRTPFAPGFRTLVGDLMYGVQSGDPESLEELRCQIPISPRSCVEGLVPVTDPGTETVYGMHLRLLLCGVLRTVLQARLLTPWEEVSYEETMRSLSQAGCRVPGETEGGVRGVSQTDTDTVPMEGSVLPVSVDTESQGERERERERERDVGAPAGPVADGVSRSERVGDAVTDTSETATGPDASQPAAKPTPVATQGDTPAADGAPTKSGASALPCRTSFEWGMAWARQENEVRRLEAESGLKRHGLKYKTLSSASEAIQTDMTTLRTYILEVLAYIDKMGLPVGGLVPTLQGMVESLSSLTNHWARETAAGWAQFGGGEATGSPHPDMGSVTDSVPSYDESEEVGPYLDSIGSVDSMGRGSFDGESTRDMTSDRHGE
ncbi:hypothetical protein KIPB_001109 [Kipferlia bialata]|uniref:Uncharacterized protein n=1 Tax=Kipferlia bialata TaxID=797122 RepID=A0A9K3CRJ8_9EUKA|nr:hypothetical protein KIPB_001109 [Kipferlia bialata]|eukprot:g1109.t1